jgi:translation initiation factor IF-3
MKNKKYQKNTTHYRVNSYIRAKQVRLVGDNVTMGVYSIADAIKMADDLNLDLLEINNNDPETPVCKILDFEKFLYEKKKSEKKQPKLDVKELRLRPATDANDLAFKLNHAKEWLTKGHLVKSSVFFKGRELAHKEFGYDILKKVLDGLEDVGTAESLPKFEGNRLVMMIKPKKNEKS